MITRMTNKHVIYWEQLCLVSLSHAFCRLPAGSPIWVSEAPRCPGKVSLPCRHISPNGEPSRRLRFLIDSEENITG